MEGLNSAKRERFWGNTTRHRSPEAQEAGGITHRWSSSRAATSEWGQMTIRAYQDDQFTTFA